MAQDWARCIYDPEKLRYFPQVVPMERECVGAAGGTFAHELELDRLYERFTRSFCRHENGLLAGPSLDVPDGAAGSTRIDGNGCDQG
jgi:hypothetical protein